MKIIINGFTPASVYAGSVRIPLMITNQRLLIKVLIKGGWE
jgi:hypothetical protein